LNISIGNMSSTFDGFKEIIEIYGEISCMEDSICEIDMSGVNWIDANMCAPLGALLQISNDKKHFRKIRLLEMKPRIRDILQKNGFLPNFGFDLDKKPDTYGTTIEYQRFGRIDSQSFRRYIERHFVGKGLPKMSPRLAQKFRESISEIFENAVDHSRTEYGIFTCGQYFPSQGRLDFSIADLGIGFRRNIFECLGKNFKSEDSIEWALEGMNTTRLLKGGKPGGFGLKLIKKFIELNKGGLQIVSDSGFWSLYQGKIEKNHFESSFPGTIVNIEINTGDKQRYCLESELTDLNPEDIF